MKTTDDYVDLITPFHAVRPKFVATVAFSVDPLARMQTALAALVDDFDLDDAVGPQLDAVGVRVGRSRNVPVPIAGLFFTFGDPIRGWGKGIWKGPYDTPAGISRLDDDTYRRLLRAKILANTWDGTTEGQQAILDAFFDDPLTLVVALDDTGAAYPGLFFSWGDPDRGWGAGIWYEAGTSIASLPTFNPKMTILVSGKIPSTLDLALLSDNLVAAKPAGVTLDYVVTSVDQAPVFGFGVQNQYVAGWGNGSWGVTPNYIATHAI